MRSKLASLGSLRNAADTRVKLLKPSLLGCALPHMLLKPPLKPWNPATIPEAPHRQRGEAVEQRRDEGGVHCHEQQRQQQQRRPEVQRQVGAAQLQQVDEPCSRDDGVIRGFGV